MPWGPFIPLLLEAVGKVAQLTGSDGHRSAVGAPATSPRIMEERQKACLAVAACVSTVLCLVSSTSAFSHGASPSACADMMPRHLRAQLHSPTNNYVTVHTNVSFYVPGDKVPGEDSCWLCLGPVPQKSLKQLLVSAGGSFAGSLSNYIRL